jgi:iron(III) transport system permease protein
MIMVNVVHMFASPYLMLYNTFGKLNENLEDVGTTLGISRFHMIKDIIIPLTETTIWDAMAYFFIQCMKTITAVAFLWTSQTKPLALKMDEYNAAVEFENVAVCTMLILGFNILYKVFVYWRQHVATKKRNKMGNVAVPGAQVAETVK